jgi:hypothetical protein
MNDKEGEERRGEGGKDEDRTQLKTTNTSSSFQSRKPIEAGDMHQSQGLRYKQSSGPKSFDSAKRLSAFSTGSGS